jgi:hypothetical protein
VRYIYLNPLRVGLVKDLKQLERYPYCRHGTILGMQTNPWQDRQSVLAQFGRREAEAKQAYRQFVAEGVELGRRPGVGWRREESIGRGMVCGEIAAATGRAGGVG